MAAKQVTACIAVVTWLLVTISVNSITYDNDSDFTVEVETCNWFPTPSKCAYYGMEFYKFRKCSLWRKSVICRKRINASNKLNKDENSLHIVTYNVRELPHLLYRKGERERTCRIPEALLRRFPTLDVIVFEELFFKGCLKGRVEMARLLKPFGFGWTYQPLDGQVSLPHFVGGGVMIASRWPIVAFDSHVYTIKKKLSSDLLGNKGVVYVAIKKGSSKYHIFGTHLQADRGKTESDVRHAQVQEIYNFKVKMDIPKDEAVIYAGDFNQDLHSSKHYINRIVETLKASLPQIVGPLRFTYDSQNPLVPNDDYDEWLDYILASKTNRQPKQASLMAVNLMASKPFEYCSFSPLLLKYVPPSSIKCFKTETTRYLSDHYPVYGVFRF